MGPDWISIAMDRSSTGPNPWPGYEKSCLVTRMSGLQELGTGLSEEEVKARGQPVWVLLGTIPSPLCLGAHLLKISEWPGYYSFQQQRRASEEQRPQC